MNWTFTISIVLLYLLIYNCGFLDIDSKFPILTIFIFLMLIFYNISFLYSKRLFNKSLIFIILMIFLTLSLYYFGLAVINYPIIHTVYKTSINFFTIIFALSIVYLAFKPIIDIAKKNTGRSNLLSLAMNLLFYIPCLIIDITEWVKYQNSITTKSIWILLGIETALISSSYLIPYLYNKLVNINNKSHILLDKPIYLDNETTINTYEKLYKNDEKKYNYTLEFDFRLNPQPMSTSSAYNKFTKILDYGNNPVIDFNAKQHELRFKFMNKILFVYKDLKYQKWINVKLKYNDGYCDIFIDNTLVSSTPNIIGYKKMDNIIVGSNNGLHGGIKNIIYKI